MYWLLHFKLKNQKKFFIALMVIFIFLLVFFILAQGVAAKDKDNNKDSDPYGLETSAEGGFGAGYKDNEDLPMTIGKVVGALLAFIGVLFFILMIYGGFLWMTAQGNDEQVTKAKNLIIAAVIGIIVVMSAYAITVYIGTKLTYTE
jgi:TRAP-type C4-dicarboxylate transport system permease small subunit